MRDRRARVALHVLRQADPVVAHPDPAVMSKPIPTPLPAPLDAAFVYRAAARRVIDGDTFIADVDLGFRVTLAVTIRVHGINAPEAHATGGAEATDFLRALLMPGGSTPVSLPLLIASYRNEQSFARWVCDVWLPSGQPLADAIINAGHAVAYSERSIV
jgi:endonuclease YncB( thermonuclease family)